MEGLIKIRKSEGGKDVVSARDLHKALEVKKHFTEWFEDNCSQFSQGVDYQALHLKVSAGPGHTIKTDYDLTIDMSKEMAMMSKVPMGKTVRQYFIACEKRLREVAQPKELSRKDLALMIVQAEEEKEIMVAQLSEATKQIEGDKPKVTFADAVSVSSSEILVRDLAKLIAQNGIDIGQNRLYDWFVEKGYLECRKRWSRSRNNYQNTYWPTQKAVRLKVFKVDETLIQKAGLPSFERPTTHVTGKGQTYFIGKYLQEFQNTSRA